MLTRLFLKRPNFSTNKSFEFCINLSPFLPESSMFVEELLVGEPLHLMLVEHPLHRAVRVRAGDVVRPLHHLKGDVLLHALQQGNFTNMLVN